MQGTTIQAPGQKIGIRDEYYLLWAILQEITKLDENISDPVTTHPNTAAINATGTATPAQVATGWITSTSAAPTTITLPTGTDLGTLIGARKGTVLELYIDNTAGSNTVTIAVNTNAILSTAAVDSGASFGDLTTASGVTGLSRYTLIFSSATAYTITRTA
jgi:hypothetical protein